MLVVAEVFRLWRVVTLQALVPPALTGRNQLPVAILPQGHA